MKKTIIIVLCALALAGCAPGWQERMEELAEQQVEASKRPVVLVAYTHELSVYRIVDEEAGMVCYISATSTISSGRGIACVPIEQTTLDGGR